jgi:PAS domain-containing protein
MQPPDFGEAPRQTQEILRESEERFRLLVEGVKDYAIFMLDAEGHITTWNLGGLAHQGL